jgi:hypothetical protein
MSQNEAGSATDTPQGVMQPDITAEPPPDKGPAELEAQNTGLPVVAEWTRGGPVLLDAHRAGARLTQRQGILAKCADCMGRYVDGRVDCRVPACPLYPWQPYREDG